jgi:hypothetical protein
MQDITQKTIGKKNEAIGAMCGCRVQNLLRLIEFCIGVSVTRETASDLLD